MPDLSTALRRATAGSREIDALIAREWLGWVQYPTDLAFWSTPQKNIVRLEKRWSTDLTACVALMQEKLPGWWWAVGRNGDDSSCIATISDDGKTNQFLGEGPTPRLALLRALTKW